MLLNVNPDHPQPRKIAKAVETLQAGGVIIYPTDTFYGLSCDLLNRRAVDRIYQIKRRPQSQPLSLICADLTDLAQYAIVSDFAYKTMRRLLPGPYTFILRATKLVPKILLTNRKEVGIRVPASPIALAIVKELGRPLISTSVNPEDPEMASDASLLHDAYGHLVDLVVDGGPQGTEPSSIISLIDDTPLVIRAGKGEVDFFEEEG